MITRKIARCLAVCALLTLSLLFSSCPRDGAMDGVKVSQSVGTKESSVTESTVVGPDALDDYVVYSAVSSDIRDRVTTQGKIGSSSYVEIGVTAQIHGNVQSSGTVFLRPPPLQSWTCRRSDLGMCSLL